MRRRLNNAGLWVRKHILPILEGVKYILVAVLAVLILTLMVRQSEQTRDIKLIVESQQQILEAIKESAEDANLTADQRTNIIICMIQVEIEARSPDVLNDCRKRAVEATGQQRPVDPKE